MMSQRCCGVLRHRSAMRKRRWTECRLGDRTAIEKQLRLIADLIVIAAGKLHHQVVRMLPVDDRHSVCSFARLKKQWVASLRHCCRLETEHQASHDRMLP